MKRLIYPLFILSLLISGCITRSSEKEFKITPDLAIGSNWLYQLRQYSKSENGKHGDTLIYFIRYEIIGDTVINDSVYRLMEEEDLAVFDSSLEIDRTLNAVKFDGEKVVIKSLKSGGAQLGRYPLKIGAHDIFDTANFNDEVTVLSFPIQKNSEWYYRLPGHPRGHGPAKKVFLGVEPLSILKKIQNAYKFELIIEDMPWVKSFEWYFENLKVKSVSYLKANNFNNDSIFFEEEFFDNRGFAKEDSQIVIDSYRKWSQ